MIKVPSWYRQHRAQRLNQSKRVPECISTSSEGSVRLEPSHRHTRSNYQEPYATVSTEVEVRGKLEGGEDSIGCCYGQCVARLSRDIVYPRELPLSSLPYCA